MEKIDLANFKHQLEVPIRFMDLDALQHVNNARYLNFLEEARIAYSQEKLNLFNNIEELNVLVARIEIDFMKPILFGEKLTLHTRISSIGRKSFVFETIFSTNDSSIVSRALQTLVTFDVVKKISIEIPKEIKEKIQLIEEIE